MPRLACLPVGRYPGFFTGFTLTDGVCYEIGGFCDVPGSRVAKQQKVPYCPHLGAKNFQKIQQFLKWFCATTR